MKSTVLHERRTSDTLSANLRYELDADRYPTLRNEFFTRLREKYPRAFQRTAPRHVEREQFSVRSSPSSADTDSIWSLWECNGDEAKAVVKEAGGVLVACSDLSVHERLKQNRDCYRSVKETGAELVVTLRNLRSALLADNNSAVLHDTVGDIGSCHSSASASRDGYKDAASNSASTSNSASQNSSCETDLIHDLPTGDEEAVGVSSSPSAECNLHAGIDAAAAAGNVVNTELDELCTESVDMDVSHPARCSSLGKEDAKNQLPSTDEVRRVDSDISLSVEPSPVVTDQRLVKSSS